MVSTMRRRRRLWLLKVLFVLVTAFAAGLVTSGVVAGAGPLAALSTSTETTDSETTASETTESQSTEEETTGGETTDGETTESTPTDTTETETETAETTETAPAGDPTILAEKDDYVPEEIVTMYGSGWLPNEEVHLFVNDDEGQSWSHHGDVTADELGAFVYEFQLPSWFVATYTVRATGSSGSVETTRFADSVAVGSSSTASNGGGMMSSQQITFSLPTVNVGDVLIAQIVVVDSIGSTFICPPSGWASIRKNAFSSTIVQETFWLRAASASAPSSDSFTIRSGSCAGSLISGKGATGGIVRFTGAIASGSPIDVSAGNAGSSSPPFTAPNVTTTVPNTLVVRYFGAFKNITISPTTSRIYTVGSSNNSKERAAAAFNSGTHAAAGAPGPGAFTAMFSSTAEYVSQTIVLKTAQPVSDAPVVSSPICAGATSVSGTSTEADGTTIEVFKNGASVGTTTVTGGAWTKGSLVALVAGDQIMARATASGETVSPDSNTVTVVTCNTAPAAAANLAQFRSNGSTAIALGGYTNETTVVLKGDVSDPDTNDSLKLEVEVKPLGTPFDGTGLVAGSAVTEPATAAATVSSLADGGYHWRARGVDDDGAQGPWTSFGANAETEADFTVDTAKPTLTASATSPPDGPAYTAGTWTNQDVKVAFACTDTGSGVGTDTVPDVTLSGDGADQSVTSTGICADEAGNQADPATFSDIDIDQTAPLVSCGSADGAWHASDVSIACTASDTASGLASSGDAAFNLTTNVPAGTETDDASTDSRVVFDNAGNSSTAGPIAGNKIDKKDPSISCTVPDQGVWYGADVTVECTASDGGSGFADPVDASFSLSTSVPAGSEDASASTTSKTVADAVGNEDAVGPFSFKVDRKAPVVGCGTADGAWHASDVSIACTASDGGSGLANAADAGFSLTTTVAAGTETANASTGTRVVADAVGNSATAGPIAGNKVDKKGPAVTLSCAANVILGSSATAGWTGVDGGSGVKSGYGSGSIALDTSSVGPKTATVPAGASQDNVDNPSAAASCSYSVVFAFQGFFQPVDNNGVFNVVQAGRAIPVKFSLGGNQGLNIFTEGYPKSTVVPCNGGSGTDVLEETSTAGSSSLQYDPDVNAPVGQYIYVWKTEKAWASSCRRLDVKLLDGTMRSALFTFKK